MLLSNQAAADAYNRPIGLSKEATEMRCFLVFCAVALASAAFADVVILKNGHRVEGKVTEHGDTVEVRTRRGAVFLKREDIASIERRATPWETFRRKLTEAKKGGADALSGLLRWCREQNLKEEAEEVERLLSEARTKEFEKRFEAAETDEEKRRLAEWARTVGLSEKAERVLTEWGRGRVEAALKEVDVKDAAALCRLAVRLESEGVPKKATESVWRLALVADGECAEARRALGMQKIDGRWLTEEQAEEVQRQKYEKEMAAKGYVFREGKWVRPDAAALAEKEDALAEKERRLERERVELESRLRRMEEERKRLEQENRRWRVERRRVIAERDSLKKRLSEAERSLERQRTEATRLTLLVGQLRREIRDLDDENRRLKDEIDRLKDQDP